MKPRNTAANKKQVAQKSSKRESEVKKEPSYSNYDYNYDDGYFNEETTTSQADFEPRRNVKKHTKPALKTNPYKTLRDKNKLL